MNDRARISVPGQSGRGGAVPSCPRSVTGAKSTKFGIPRDEIVRAYERIAGACFMPFGLHRTSGAGVQDTGPFVEVTDVLVGI